MISHFMPDWIPSDPLVLSLYVALLAAGLVVGALVLLHGPAIALVGWYVYVGLASGLLAGYLTYSVIQDSGTQVTSQSEDDTMVFDLLTLEKTSDNQIRITVTITSTQKEHKETLILSEPIDPQVAQIAKKFNLKMAKIYISNKGGRILSDREIEYVFSSLLRAGIVPIGAPWSLMEANSDAN